MAELPPKRPHTSRQRYRRFVDDYRSRRLDQLTDAARSGGSPDSDGGAAARKGKRRQFIRDYLTWLSPHRYRVGVVFLLAMTAAGLQLVEPLFMRNIIDRVLLNPTLDASARLTRLNLIGITFLAVIVLSNLASTFKDYRQRLLNVRVMLSLRRAEELADWAHRRPIDQWWLRLEPG